MAVAIFEVAGQMRQAMSRSDFDRSGRIGLDAYPYRALKRGELHLAVFVVSSGNGFKIVGLGRVAPGDRSGISNRNLEFDLCRKIKPEVVVQPDNDAYPGLIRALNGRTPLNGSEEQDLLSVISNSADVAARDVEFLLEQVGCNAIEGNDGFLLACERDAVALSLKAANLQAELPKLSGWQLVSSCPWFIGGLDESRDSSDHHSSADRELSWLQEGAVPSSYSWMRVARRTDGYGPGVTMVNARPDPNSELGGVDLVYFNPNFGVLTLIHYGADWILDEYLDEIDDLYAGEDDPSDPRLVSNPVFVKRVNVKKFEVEKEWLLGGAIRVAQDIRNHEISCDAPFRSERHLSNGTFAALLGAGWLGGRAAGFEQVRDVVELALEARRAVVVAIHGNWDVAESHHFGEQWLF